MKDSCYIVVDKRSIKSKTVYKNKPPLEAGEISIKINVELPNIIFDTPTFEGNLKVSEAEAKNKIVKQLEFELKQIIEKE